MDYKVILSREAEKFLDKLEDKTYDKLYVKLQELATNPYKNNLDIKKLKGVENNCRLRVGDYRVLYSIENKMLIIFVIEIRQRKDMY